MKPYWVVFGISALTKDTLSNNDAFLIENYLLAFVLFLKLFPTFINTMIKFTKTILAISKGKSKYKTLLAEYLSNGTLEGHEKYKLEELANQYNLSKKDLLSIHKQSFKHQFQKSIEDEIISEEEKEALEELISFFKVDKSQIGFNQSEFNKYYTLGLISKGILPDIDSTSLNIQLKKSEKLHWVCPAELLKYIRVSNRTSYSGPTASIKIMKGLNYRVGSIKHRTSSTKKLDSVDSGLLWITNTRLGYLGESKSISIPINKVLSISYTDSGLQIFKEGRENPYIISLDEYEVPCLMISILLNQQE